MNMMSRSVFGGLNNLVKGLRILKKPMRFDKCLCTKADQFQSTTQPTVDSATETSEAPGSKWKGRNGWKLGAMFLSSLGFAGFAISVYEFGPPEKDEAGKEISDEYSNMSTLPAYICRTWGHLVAFRQTIRDPSSMKLLPDPVPWPYQPPYTVVLEIKDILVHPEWTFKSGWRFKKRAALEVFLQQLSPYYEVVTFTSESLMTVAPVLEQIDSKGQYIHYRLFRDATRYEKGKHIKDLACLNRDLSRVILIEWSQVASELQPRNTLLIRRWMGEDDKELIDLAAFLRMLAMSGVEDVRLALDYYKQFDDPIAAFREKQGQLMDTQQRKKVEVEKSQGKERILTALRWR